ncbi:MAG: ribosomal subunit interface protein [Candidatus Taylorbacteria bacterium RIFCSPHIGHO2_02_FULL_44_36]|uniref:Ribosomal subunit interface protein n=1 Tax=Candidatus Taylorbacteria bacterium RIFCSPLOWO2_12_FULL_44_15c TaxID=1802333 RepID=A0A1G2P976_9BACT|nr:MAG: ribosomal subunit interface protein [Candidatus Taylorbacteria bacterium RIFCSPHIGHO2_02_FULL_44_36]OHA39256.1 MAG: ribosomal subunit interface protein [Candidatus Taylorbacteria bacterium RIFCSPLOWO2_02_FULL_44_35]OHA44131.1 MAG: ribosomal subunit interface protein [Candidatus Taylorbacteria bacterium RIFCSPLOWO2_12_FULL_44_15c]
MKINIKGTNLSVSPDINGYLSEKLKSVVKLIDPNDETAIFDIELGRTTRHHQTGDIFRAEINFHRRDDNYRAVSEAGDIFSAIDLVKDRILDELRGAKGRRLRFIRKSGRQIKEWLRRFYRR